MVSQTTTVDLCANEYGFRWKGVRGSDRIRKDGTAEQDAWLMYNLCLAGSDVTNLNVQVFVYFIKRLIDGSTAMFPAIINDPLNQTKLIHERDSMLVDEEINNEFFLTSIDCRDETILGYFVAVSSKLTDASNHHIKTLKVHKFDGNNCANRPMHEVPYSPRELKQIADLVNVIH